MAKLTGDSRGIFGNGRNRVCSLTEPQGKTERYEGEFMSKKDGPTIILDLNFISDDQSILDFINESVAWAKKLDEIVGGISLRLIRRDYTTAQFMWAGKLFIELTPSVVIGRESWQYFRDLVSKTIGQFHCNGAPKAEVWERAFKPNLYLAINREKWRLEKLGQDICAIKNPEINEKSSQ